MCRLKQLDEIAGRIHQQDLRSTRTGHDVITEAHTGSAKPRDLGRKIIDNEMNAVPSPGRRTLAIRQGPAGRAQWPAEQQPQ